MQAVVVRDDRIAHVGELRPEDRDLPTREGSRKTVIPGLIDAHVHLSLAPGGAFVEDVSELLSLAKLGPTPQIRLLGPLLSPPGGYVRRPARAPRSHRPLSVQLEAFDLQASADRTHVFELKDLAWVDGHRVLTL